MAPNAQQLLQVLRDPVRSLPAFGQVHDQKTGQFIQYDPNRLTYTMQQDILQYASNPPKTSAGQTRFFTILTARQMGKSLSTEYACYPKAAYNPGWDHVCIADTNDRATYLHKRLHHLHERWPLKVRSQTIPNREARQLTFRPLQGGKMRILSGESGAVGIGQSPDSFHASECAFWSDFGGSMFLINPSLINRDHALVTFECTPWEARSDWHEHCLDAKKGAGRHYYKFYPYWDGKLNIRPWENDWVLENEEIDMLTRYGPQGLTKENLAFRRFIMETDQQLRRHPEFFNVFYPSDDISCWLAGVVSAIPDHVLQKHRERELVPWKGPYQEYEAPEADAIYAIGADPCGHAARDHAAFHVLKCFDGEWTQVAAYADHSDPLVFSQKLIDIGKRYNNARIVVESNGVGQAVLSLLREWQYPNIYFEKARRPGFTSTAQSVDKTLGWLIDGLMDELILNDADTVEQCFSYKNDKRIEESASAELVRGGPSKKRRDRHHWDKVSALQMAIVCARNLPRKRKIEVDDETGHNVIHIRPWTYDERRELHKDRARQKRKKYWI